MHALLPLLLPLVQLSLPMSSTARGSDRLVSCLPQQHALQGRQSMHRLHVRLISLGALQTATPSLEAPSTPAGEPASCPA